MENVYRTKISYWLLEVIAVALFLVALIPFAIYFNTPLAYILSGFCIIVGFPFVFVNNLRSALNNQITLNSYGVSGKVDRVEFSLNWSNIKMASNRGQGQAKQLVLGTDEGLTTIELKYFDEVDLWKNLKTNMPSEVFAEKAYRNLSGYKEWKEESAQSVNQFTDPVVVRYYKSKKIFGWIIVIISASLASYSIFGANQVLTALMIICFFLFPGLILIIASVGKIEVDVNGIARKTIFGRFAIQWDEIREVLVTHNGQAMSLIGDNKRF
jgi:hypothetical protein